MMVLPRPVPRSSTLDVCLLRSQSSVGVLHSPSGVQMICMPAIRAQSQLWVVHHGCTAEDGNTAEQMAGYVSDLLDDVLLDTTQKPHGKTLDITPITHTSISAALDYATQHSVPVEIGSWVRRAMCLVPLQISRCNGNTLEPMHDGEPRCDVDGDEDIVELSKQLRWGLYECLLNSHEGPVVIVCALGQQSVGKSYQLNHLGGVFFDVAGGRCTDGVWLSARAFHDEDGKERLALFLDCEGIGSLERTETEDMLHCLLAGAISSLTMFKTHFAFNTYALQLILLAVSLQVVLSVGDAVAVAFFQVSCLSIPPLRHSL
jgi:hypothetical protein